MRTLWPKKPTDQPNIILALSILYTCSPSHFFIPSIEGALTHSGMTRPTFKSKHNGELEKAEYVEIFYLALKKKKTVEEFKQPHRIFSTLPSQKIVQSLGMCSYITSLKRSNLPVTVTQSASNKNVRILVIKPIKLKGN